MSRKVELTNHVTPREVDPLLTSNSIFLIDVREPSEFASERIFGSGKRSLDAAQRWLASGRAIFGNLEGGLAAWKRAGPPVLSQSP